MKVVTKPPGLSRALSWVFIILAVLAILPGIALADWGDQHRPGASGLTCVDDEVVVPGLESDSLSLKLWRTSGSSAQRPATAQTLREPEEASRVPSAMGEPIRVFALGLITRHPVEVAFLMELRSESPARQEARSDQPGVTQQDAAASAYAYVSSRSGWTGTEGADRTFLPVTCTI